MSALFWLTYSQSGRPHCVILLEAQSLIASRMKAAIRGLDKEASFGEGHELDAATARQIPVKMMGRRLTLRQARVA